MSEQQQSLEDLQHIKKMMERSSRFISLSGLSGIAAGICALVGAIVAYPYVYGKKDFFIDADTGFALARAGNYRMILYSWLFWIAAFTFMAALISAFVFTYIRSKKEHIPLWGTTAKRLMINVAIPLFAGGLFLIKLIQVNATGLIAPACLIFYGLALVNASKYTLGELRYLGYGQLILAVINLWFTGYGIYFWAAGFGILHIVYGFVMWYRYEKR
jgi:hypothetical protein